MYKYQLYEYYDNRWHSFGVYDTRKEAESKKTRYPIRVAVYRGRKRYY